MSELETNEFEINECGLSFLFWISLVINRLSDCWLSIYSNNAYISTSADNISYFTTWSCNSLQRKRTAPNETIWGSGCKIINNNELIEEFVYEYTIGIPVHLGYFLVYHHPNYVLCSGSTIIERNEVPVYSEIRFLSIEYTHPEMRESIQLVLEKEWCIVGNELLGRIHILRMLEYQLSEGSYIFDDRYVLKIIDSNINVFDINSSQYIRLGSDNYEIIE